MLTHKLIKEASLWLPVGAVALQQALLDPHSTGNADAVPLRYCSPPKFSFFMLDASTSQAKTSFLKASYSSFAKAPLNTPGCGTPKNGPCALPAHAKAVTLLPECDSPEKSIFFSYLAENKQARFVPWLLNFNGFREKLICRIKAQLSQGFLLSEHQTLRSPAESANEEQDTSWGSTATAGPGSGSQTSGESTEMPRALLCFLMPFIQGAASHSPELSPLEIPVKNNPGAQTGCGTVDMLPAPALPALGQCWHQTCWGRRECT